MTARRRTSANGASRMLECADGWIALSLGRADDIDLLPAWLALAGADDRSAAVGPHPDPDQLARVVSKLGGADLVRAATLVGLPVGLLDERAADPTGGVTVTPFGPAARTAGSDRPLQVLDLSALWAGPLCASLLGAAGAEVVKVETPDRPDTLRIGRPELYAQLNADKQLRQVEVTELHALVATADVVVESARPRGLEQLGIVAADLLARPDGPQVWVSITGHGRASNRVAFGDDAAVAGGLVARTADGPEFLGDALADPLSGLAAAAAALEVLASGRRALVDVAMAGVAAR